ncbi:amino Acid/Auxin permease family [Micromonas pusilla CCMP1545]|uniref:Amino Acid/Auxin permease family n=1 Tax=Micromonas pusilla (strain CCMP1545) TaxID=564608 RepID=C1N6A8_MICPC|nr:amino Acid/Auxin permease family [Micromonas pusilla CCMP1545]EEH52637.1 amino Acid/Auxin permease family [Micromonas pusilla CCMP1545]|eukprot:XP_003063501.1 amino Acid/Auxin permease family [Micromonas pusilla CCMP1545]
MTTMSAPAVGALGVSATSSTTRRRRRASTASIRASAAGPARGRVAAAVPSRATPNDDQHHHRLVVLSARSSPPTRTRTRVVASASSAAAPTPATGGDGGEAAAVINTVKAIFGAGGFALPWAFANGGTALVTACLAFSYVFALTALKMLVKAQDVLVASGQSSRAAVATYAGLTKEAVGPVGDVVCKALNVITCFGISVGYMIFVSDTVISMLPAQHAASFTTASMIARTLPAWLGLAFVRDFKGVNLISLLGTASVSLGMLWVTAVAASNPLQVSAIPLANLSAFSGFFGTVAFLFFIHFTLFSVQEAMPDQTRFVPAVSKAFAIAMGVSVVFGVVGAFGFGPGVNSVVITMLTGVGGTIVKALLCVNLLFTFPLMARSALVILESTIARGKEISVPASLATRAAFVLSAGYLAGNVPNFGTVLGLVGGVCCCAMSIAMPPAILKLANDRAGVKSSAGESAVIALVCLTGVVCMVLSVVL